MARRAGDSEQPRLFNDSPRERALDAVPPAGVDAEARVESGRLDPRIRLGTSSWSFPGWKGLVYARDHSETDLARQGLAAYSEQPLFRTVGLDRAFYQPLSVEEYARLGWLTPDGFRFLIKAHQAITRPHADEAGRTFGDTATLSEHGRDNPLFLDVQYAIDRVIGPATVGLKEKAGPIVFQFPPMDLRPAGGAGAAKLVERIGEFLSNLPRAGSDRWGGPRYVVEIRSRELLRPERARTYVAALKAGGAAHGWVVHPTMPTLEEQAAAMSHAGYAASEQPVMCLRWLLRHGLSYEGAKERYWPFTKIVDDDPATRGEVLRLIRAALAAEREVFVIANNKAEGSGPLTIARIAEELRREADRAANTDQSGD